MAENQIVPADGSLLSRLDRAYHRSEQWLALGAGLIILGVMVLSVAQILGRKLLDLPVPGYIDWMEQAVPLIAFLGIGYCQRLGGHIRMDIVMRQLKGRALLVAEFLGVFLMLVLVLLISYGAWLHFERAFDWNAPLYSRDSTIDLSLPTWPVKLMVPLMLWLFSLRLVLQLWAYARGIVRGDDAPAGVPRVVSAAEQAEAEASTVSGADPSSADATPGGGRQP